MGVFLVCNYSCGGRDGFLWGIAECGGDFAGLEGFLSCEGMKEDGESV